MDKQYKGIEGRDIEWLDDQGGYYIRHVSAMTAEGLHSKAAIAAELAYRDWCIDSSESKLAAAEARIAELESYNVGLATESHQQQERIAALEKALWDIRITIEGNLDVTIRDLVNGIGHASDAYADRDKIVAYCDAALLKEKE